MKWHLKTIEILIMANEAMDEGSQAPASKGGSCDGFRLEALLIPDGWPA